MVLKIAIIVIVVLVALVAAVLGYAALKPSTFRVERSMNIQAPPEAIFPLINDFHRWTTWSPYEKRDPEMKRTYSGAPEGQGTVYQWDGNKDVGSGRMEIMETKPPAKVTIKLDFFTPFEGHNTAEFTMDGHGNSTNVTWAMGGPQPFTMKVMGIFLDMDAMIGKDFETGLANLKTLVEK